MGLRKPAFREDEQVQPSEFMNLSHPFSAGRIMKVDVNVDDVYY
jgi:hypothetical protein